MKTFAKILILCGLLFGSTIYYLSHYTYIKAAGDKLLFFNPFQPDQDTFDKYYGRADLELASGDTINAKKDFAKALRFHGTHNEKQRENIYSDANDLWEYKLDKLLKYSKAYELTGSLDSAISCLSSGLTSFEKWHFPIDRRFFQLAVRKFGKDKTIELIKTGLDKTGKPNCYHCCDYYFEFNKFKVGIDENQFDLIKTDKNKLLTGLCEDYGI